MTTTISGPRIVETAVDTLPDAIFVTTMSSVGLMDRVPGDRLVYPAVAMMGAASTIGLGLALGRDDLDVVVLDGDGSLLMELGSLVTIAAVSPRNLIHIVLHNGMWFHETADLVIPGHGLTDFCGLAESAGYPFVRAARTEEALAEAILEAKNTSGPAFILVAMSSVGGATWTSQNPQPDLPDAYFDRVPREAAELTAALAAIPVRGESAP